MTDSNKKDRLYWVATTGEYGSNLCRHVDLSAWTEEQWDMFDSEIAEQDRFTFIERWRKENNQPDWGDATGLVQQAIDYLQEEYDAMNDPESEPAEAGIRVSIALLAEWLDHVKTKQPQPALPYHYNTPEDEVPTFAEIEAERQ